MQTEAAADDRRDRHRLAGAGPQERLYIINDRTLGLGDVGPAAERPLERRHLCGRPGDAPTVLFGAESRRGCLPPREVGRENVHMSHDTHTTSRGNGHVHGKRCVMVQNRGKRGKTGGNVRMSTAYHRDDGRPGPRQAVAVGAGRVRMPALLRCALFVHTKHSQGRAIFSRSTENGPAFP